MLPEMNDKSADIGSIAGKALADKELLAEILDGMKVKDETLRYNCHKVLMELTREHGDVLFPHWDYFVGMLDSPNTYHRLSASQLLSRLCKVDREGRFEKIFDKYFAQMSDKGTVLAAHVTFNAGIVAAAKPYLRARITRMLLDFDNIYKGKQPEMTKAYVIGAFGEYYDHAENKEEIKDSVRKMLDSTSPKTKKLAREFLDRRG
jgi:hypothetical protein